TWDYLDPGEEHFRPQIARFEDGSVIRLGARANNDGLPRTPSQLFFAGDSWTRFVPAHGAMSPHVNMYEPGMLDLTDPAARIEALDALGIDVQVLFSTFYIGMELDNPLEEAALARSYNRWVGEHLAGHTDRPPRGVGSPGRGPPTVWGGCWGRRGGGWSGRSRSWSTPRATARPGCTCAGW